MNKPRSILALFTTLLLALFTLGCSAESSGGFSDSSPSRPSVSENTSNQPPSVEITSDEGQTQLPELSQLSSQPPVLDERKIIKHVDMRLETKEFNKALDQILQQVKELGGFIESMSADGSGIESEEYHARSANISARIPSDRLSHMQKLLNEQHHVTSQNERMEDISDSYFDTQARLKSLQIQEERLLEILANAENLEDIITLEQALSQVRHQIETLTASINRMDSQVAYSYLNIYLQEVVIYQTTTPSPKKFGDRLLNAAQSGWRNFIILAQNMILIFVELLPLIVIVALLILFFSIMYKRRKKHQPQLTHQPQWTPAKNPYKIPPQQSATGQQQSQKSDDPNQTPPTD